MNRPRRKRLVDCLGLFGRGSLMLAIAMMLFGSASAADPTFDIILRHGRVIDGTGAPWYYADLALRGGRIAAIGRFAGEATKEIDASGLFIAPGFIDMMGQTATPLLSDPSAARNLLTQGVTTINCGEGASAAPLAGEEARQKGWSTMAEYFARLDAAGLPINMVQTVGHTQIRRLVLGEIDRRPFPLELEEMCNHVREAMQAGAIGVSTALIYPPAVYAQTEELSVLARAAADYGGGYYTHMRNEGERLVEAIDEALSIGRSAGCRVHIFHLKAAGQENWDKLDGALERIKSARAGGQQVAVDVYPYLNNGLGITAFIHPRHAALGNAKLHDTLGDPKARAEIRREMETRSDFENWYLHVGHDWDRVILGSMPNEPYSRYNGRSVAAMARGVGQDPWTVFFEAARHSVFCMPQTMSEANLVRIMQEPFTSFCTDAGPSGGSPIATHPRASGTFPRILARYVREQKALSWEQAVARMTTVAANELLLFDRGRIAVGLAADLAVFDPEKIVDRATFAEPNLEAEGVRYVIVGGQLVWNDGKQTTARPGRVLRGPGYRAKKPLR